MKKLFLLFIGLSIAMPNLIMAKPNPFPYTTSGNIPVVVALHDRYTITYTINPIVPLQTPITVTLNTTSSDFTKTITCKRDQKNHIIQCSVVVHFSADNLGDQSAELIARDLKFPIFDIKLQSIVKQKGHFIYLKSGQPINALNLGPNDSGTIRLKIQVVYRLAMFKSII